MSCAKQTPTFLPALPALYIRWSGMMADTPVRTGYACHNQAGLFMVWHAVHLALHAVHAQQGMLHKP